MTKYNNSTEYKPAEIAVTLARVSSAEQEDNYSHKSQDDTVLKYCKDKELEVLKSWSTAESSTRGDRKDFNEMRKYALSQNKKRKEPIAIVCYSVDRFQRRFEETITFQKLIKEEKIEIHFIKEGLIISAIATPNDMLQWNMLVMMADNFIRNLSSNVRRGNKKKLELGEWPGRAPFGYENYKVDKKSWVRVKETHRDIIKWMFEAYSTGAHSYTTIAKELVKRGYLKKAPSGRWPVSTVERIMKDPFYHGVMVRNGDRYTHVYETIIDEELFLRVQKVIDSNNNRKYLKVQEVEYPYNHTMHCNGCDGSIVGYSPKEGYRYYRCSNSGCEQYCISIPEKKMLEDTIKILEQVDIDEATVQKAVEKIQSSYNTSEKVRKVSKTRLKQKLGKLDTKIENLYIDKLEGSITADIYSKLNDKFTLEKKVIQKELEKLSEDNILKPITVKKALSLVNRVGKLFEQAAPREKNYILKLLFCNSSMEGRKVNLSLKQEVISIFNIRGHPAWQG